MLKKKKNFMLLFFALGELNLRISESKIKLAFIVFFVKKKRETFLSFSLSTQSRDRTGMEVNPLVFETSASTNSAIWACSFHNVCVVF